MVTRCRAFLLALALTGMPFFSAIAAEPDHLRLGLVKFGSGAWEIDTLRANGLDQAAGVAFDTVDLANPAAGEVALQAGGVDAIITDWLWVSRQRRAGHKIVFIPHSSALGEIVVPGSSPIHGLAALEGHRLGIAGGPLDKSWLLVRAYSRRLLGHDLADHVEVVYGAPPLLSQELAAEHVDAVLTFWPFAARAEADGQRIVVTLDQVLSDLGFTTPVPFVGYVFSAAWAAQHAGALQRFLAATDAARHTLDHDDAAWDSLQAISGAKTPAQLAALRRWYRAGHPTAWTSKDIAAAGRVYELLDSIGGPGLVGKSKHIVEGTFWRAPA